MCAAHAEGELAASEQPSKQQSAAAQALFAALEQVCCCLSNGPLEEDQGVESLIQQEVALADGSREREGGDGSAWCTGCAHTEGQMGLEDVAAETIMSVLALLVSNDCSRRDAGVNKLFACHLHFAARGAGEGGAGGEGGGGGGHGGRARRCSPPNTRSRCKMCDNTAHTLGTGSDADTLTDADTITDACQSNGVQGSTAEVTSACGRAEGDTDRPGQTVGGCIMGVEYVLLRRDPRVCLGLIGVCVCARARVYG